MSDLRVAVVAEGETDRIIIESILSKLLEDHTYILTQLQPISGLLDGHQGSFGGGWGGVYKWCRQVSQWDCSLLEENPTLENFDLIIIHIDADVSDSSYSDISIYDAPNDDLPCDLNCPPARDTTEKLEKVLLGWLNQNDTGSRTVFCIPSWCTESWIAAVLYGQTDNALLENIECNKDIYQYLLSKPRSERLLRIKDGKVKKITSKYRELENKISSWDSLYGIPTQAQLFSDRIGIVIRGVVD